MFLTDEWINKMWYIHTVDYYYSAIKRNEVSVHATTWINPENIMLSERNQSYTHTCKSIAWFHLYESPK